MPGQRIIEGSDEDGADWQQKAHLRKSSDKIRREAGKGTGKMGSGSRRGGEVERRGRRGKVPEQDPARDDAELVLDCIAGASGVGKGGGVEPLIARTPQARINGKQLKASPLDFVPHQVLGEEAQLYLRWLGSTSSIGQWDELDLSTSVDNSLPPYDPLRLLKFSAKKVPLPRLLLNGIRIDNSDPSSVALLFAPFSTTAKTKKTTQKYTSQLGHLSDILSLPLDFFQSPSPAAAANLLVRVANASLPTSASESLGPTAERASRASHITGLLVFVLVLLVSELRTAVRNFICDAKDLPVSTLFSVLSCDEKVLVEFWSLFDLLRM